MSNTMETISSNTDHLVQPSLQIYGLVHRLIKTHAYKGAARIVKQRTVCPLAQWNLEKAEEKDELLDILADLDDLCNTISGLGEE